MNIFKLSWKNLTSKPLAMLLSLVLFALGVGLISLLLLINKQLEDKFQKNLAGIDLVVGAKGSPLQLILNSMYHVDAPTGNITIGEAKAFLREGHPLIKIAVPLSVGDSYESYRIIGTNHKILELY
ncbi:MAG: putative ABC transport system permease protein, partial [Saprospiraceae bacterium]